MILHDLHGRPVFVRKDAINIVRLPDDKLDVAAARAVLTVDGVYLAVKEEFNDVVGQLKES
jgi:hypothetical protein